MVETGVVREFEPGFYAVTLPPCSTAVLPLVLDPTVPVVWVVGHYPGSHVHWWHAALPLSERTPLRELRVRDVEFDIQLSTREFRSSSPSFATAGSSSSSWTAPFQIPSRWAGSPTRRDTGCCGITGCTSSSTYRTLASTQRSSRPSMGFWRPSCSGSSHWTPTFREAAA